MTPTTAAMLVEGLGDEPLTDPGALRARLVSELRRMLDEGRAEAEKRLIEEGDGLACARRLCAVMDAVVLAVHDAVVRRLYPADNPSTSERLAVAATGGYGRGTLAPGSDVDLLFLLPYKQTAWGESVVEAILYVLWDLKLKVGHATRSVDECVREAKADMTIRTSMLESRFLFGDESLFQSLVKRFDAEVVKGTAAEFVDAKLRERDARLPRPGLRATSSSRTSRTARAACVTSTRCSGSPSTSTACATSTSSSRRGSSPPRRRLFSRAARSSCGGCAATCISSPAAPRSA